MNTPTEIHISPPFRKVLKFVALQMLIFVLLCIVIGFRRVDMLIALICFASVVTPIFTIITRSMLSFTIGEKGIRSLIYSMEWSQISTVKSIFLSPMYAVKTKGLLTGRATMIPKQSLLSDDVSLAELVSRYSPDGHPFRQILQIQ